MTIAGAVVIVVLVVAAAFLSAAETVISRTGVVRALRLDDEDNAGSGALLELAEHPARPLNVVLFLMLTVRIVAVAVLVAMTAAWGGWAIALAVAGFVLVAFVVTDVGPRTYTLRNLDRVGLGLAPGIAALSRLLHPVAHALGSAGGLLAGHRRRPTVEPLTADEELRRLLAVQGHDDDEIEADERAMIHSIFELGDTVCREIMVPRPDMVTVGVDEAFRGVVETAVQSGYSRIPVTTADPGEIVGIVYAKDLLQRLHAPGPGDGGWSSLLREPTFVPESKRADELLRDLRREKVHLAIVVDEYGAVAGLVTIEDILEEIVGEIVDEYDTEEPPVVRLDDRRLRVSGRVTVHDLNDMLDVDLPEEEGWDTVGGLVVGLLGRVPQPGEAAVAAGITFVAERVQGRRVGRVLVSREADDGTRIGDTGVIRRIREAGGDEGAGEAGGARPRSRSASVRDEGRP